MANVQKWVGQPSKCTKKFNWLCKCPKKVFWSRQMPKKSLFDSANDQKLFIQLGKCPKTVRLTMSKKILLNPPIQLSKCSKTVCSTRMSKNSPLNSLIISKNCLSLANIPKQFDWLGKCPETVQKQSTQLSNSIFWRKSKFLNEFWKAHTAFNFWLNIFVFNVLQS